MSPTLKIGLFGFGCVGQGLWDVLHRTKGLQTEITRICVKDRNKLRPIGAGMFTFEKNDILEDPNVDVVVELIDDADAAFAIVKSALLHGKAVVTANKKMVASNFAELLELQQATGKPVLYEASCCGSIPIIRNLEEYYDNDMLDGVQGIVNGTTNYILTKLTETSASYDDVLREAQQLGFAESDPTLDVEGYDAAFKTLIMGAHAFGTVLRPDDVIRRGITAVSAFDAVTARAHGNTIKLLSQSRILDGKLTSYVLPAFVPSQDPLATVRNEYNAVLLHGAFSDAQFFVGKGAGGHPTASAVLSDLAALRYAYKYEYKKIEQGTAPALTTQVPVRAYVRSHSADLVSSVPFTDVEVEYRSGANHYVIGTTLLESLYRSEAFADSRTFIATL